MPDVAVDVPAALGGADGAAAAEGLARDQSGVVTVTVADRKVVRNAAVSVRVTDLDKGAADLRAIAVAAKGQVISESISTGGEPGVMPMPIEPGQPEDKMTTSPAEPGTAFLTLTVPAEQLDAVLARIAAVGTITTRMVTSAEVTGEYVDVQARVASMTASVARIRALMGEAKNIGDLIALESELSERQSELEAVKARLQSLDSQISMSTLSVTMTTPATPVVDEEDNGFLAGFTSGLTALGAAFVIGLTIVGAILPFLLVLAVILAPVAIWRSRRDRTSAESPASPSVPVSSSSTEPSASSADPSASSADPDASSEPESTSSDPAAQPSAR